MSALRGSVIDRSRLSSNDLNEIDEEDDDEEGSAPPTSATPIVNVIKAEDVNYVGQPTTKRPSALGSSLRGTRKKSAKGELRYVLTVAEPSSPRLALSQKSRCKWESRVCNLSGASQNRTNERRCQSTTAQPTLSWYADELSFACRRMMVSAPIGAHALQERHNANPKVLADAKQLWTLLLELAVLFSATSYHVQRGIAVLGSDATKSLPSGRRTSSAALHRFSFDAAAETKSPFPPFAPKSADGALADLHLNICKLQTMGPQLAMILRRLAEGAGDNALSVIERLLDAAPKRGKNGAFGEFELATSDATPPEPREDAPRRIQELFLIVPCLEEGMERLSALLSLIDRLQLAKLSDKENKLIESDTDEKSEADDDLENAGDTGGDVNVALESDQVLVEVAVEELEAIHAMKTNSRPSSALRPDTASNGGSRPTSATRGNPTNETIASEQTRPKSPLQIATASIDTERKDKKEEKSEKSPKKKGKKKKNG